MKIFMKSICLAAVAVLAAGCAGVKEITYFQDANDTPEIVQSPVQTLRVGVSDKLFIIVHSKNPELAAIFNLPVSTRQVGGLGESYSGYNQVASYTVDSKGNIDFPVLGTIHVGGLTREEVAATIKDMIISSDYIKDAVVIVEFSNLNISVLGEVARPGRYPLDKDRITVLDAIAKAGDLTINGRRTDVLVYREENGVQKVYHIDLTSGESIFTSPVYYLRQDDVIYVEPNEMRKRASTVNGNNILSAPFWVSMGSFLVSVTTMVLTGVRVNPKGN